MSEIAVINNYVDIPEEANICRHTRNNTIMFLGKMDYEPNITAVKYFADNVFPSLKSIFHGLEFVIVGAKPTNEILALEQRNGIKVTGYVKSTEPYFQNSTIVIAPMLSGAGVQNKIIQAMAYGCCVATTDIGAEGLTLCGDDLVVLNGSDKWINGLKELLTYKTKRLEYGKCARETVKATLSKEIIFNQFCKVIEKIQSK